MSTVQKTYTFNNLVAPSNTVYLFRMYSPMDMGWSVVEGEGVADKLGGGAPVDVDPPLLELAERLNLKREVTEKAQWIP